MAPHETTPDAGVPPIVPDAMAIRVRPEYAPEHSDPAAWRYVFVYHITIENVGTETAQLFWRHWLIHDLVAGGHEVEGEGVVGQSPVLETGGFAPVQQFLHPAGSDGSHGGVLPLPAPRRIRLPRPGPALPLHRPARGRGHAVQLTDAPGAE